MNIDTIEKIRKAGTTSSIIWILKKCPETSVQKLLICNDRQLKEVLKAEEITPELIQFVANTEDIVLISRVVEALNYGFPLVPDIIEYAKSLKKLDIICKARDKVSMNSIFYFCNPKMDVTQITEILKGLEKHLSINKLKYYANPDRFDGLQMREIRKAFLYGLKSKEVKSIAESNFSAAKMRQMRKGYESGLDFTQVMIYAQDYFDEMQMYQIRRVIEQGFCPKIVAFIANPTYSSKQMDYIREALETGISMEQIETFIDLPEKELKERLNSFQEEILKNM